MNARTYINAAKEAGKLRYMLNKGEYDVEKIKKLAGIESKLGCRDPTWFLGKAQ